MWVTTRPHLREELEDKLQQLSYTLQPFSEFEQVEFLKKFWAQTLNIEDKYQHRLQIYGKTLIRKLAQSISDKDRQFTGIPLLTRMVAEVFKEECKSFCLSDKSQAELPHKLDLLGLYKRFIESTYTIYYEEKSKIQEGNVGADGIPERDLIYMQNQHQLLALKALFTEDKLTFLPIDLLSTLSGENLARIGLAQENNEGKPQFIHRTVAEYHVAEFLIKQLTKETKQITQVQELLLSEVLFKKDCHLIRAFLDKLLEDSEPSNEALIEYGKKIHEQWEKRKLPGSLDTVTEVLHTAAKEDNARIVGLLLESLQHGENLSTVTEMLLATDLQKQTAWHKAAEKDSVQALKKIWEWAEKVTTWQEGAARGYPEAPDTTRSPAEEEERQPNQIKDKLFVDKDMYGNTAWHGAAQSGSAKALETLWSLAKEAQMDQHKLLLGQNEEGYTTWQLAAQTGHLKLLQKLGVWVKDAQLNPNELKNKFLLDKDKYGYTVWHRAAECGSLEALKTLWDLCKESELKPDEIFLDPGKDGNTAWQMAAKGGHFKVLKEMWEWANGEQMNRNVSKEKLILARGQYGRNTWHRAAERGSFKALETLWTWAKEAELNEAENDHFEILEKLWIWAKETQKNPKDLKLELLLAKDQYGYTVWHRAAQRGSLEELETLWSWAQSANKPS
jgi:ankyrin repeat protein